MIKTKLKKYKMQIKQMAVLNLKIISLEKSNPQSSTLKKSIDLLESIKSELEELDIALECLEDEDAYLVKEHYIMGRTWLNIYANYNRVFKDKPRLEIEALRKKADKSLKILKEFFEPFEQLEQLEQLEQCVNA